MRTALPSRIDSGILLIKSGIVHRNGGDGHTICRLVVGDNATPVSDNTITTHRLGKCTDCWRLT